MTPVMLNTESNKVSSVEFCFNKLEGEAFKQISVEDKRKSYETIKADLVICSIGYKPKKIFGDHFDYNSDNTIKNENGLVIIKNNGLSSCIYTSGWMKRGAKGILDETLHDSQESFSTFTNNTSYLRNIDFLANFSITAHNYQSKNEGYTLNYRGLFNQYSEEDINYRLITKEKFFKILQHEESNGKTKYKISEKLVSRKSMLEIANH